MPTSTLRPDSLISGGGVAVGGGAAAVTSDNSDATYVETTVVTFGLGDFTLPAGAAVAGCRLRARARYDTVGAVLVLALQRSDGSTVGSVLTAALTASFADITAGTVVGLTTEADVDGARLMAGGLNGGGVEIAELYVDVLYATQPSVSVTAPTGTVTDTTRPTVEWSYTQGSDGGTQSRYRVKVFSAAQYGALGFSPETSTPAWDSGDLLGAVTSIELTSDLTDGLTYRAYVKAAQTINGSAHWSEWDFEQFDLTAADPPGAPTIALTPQNDQGRIRLEVTAGTGDFDLVDAERSDDGGATWTWVRGFTRADPPGSVLIGYDYEAPNGQTSLYRARAINTDGAAAVAGPWSSTASTQWSSTANWLKDLRDTSLNMQVMIESLPSVRRDIPQGVNRVLGRSTPIVVSDVRHSIVGTVTLLTFTDDDADALLALLATTETLLLQTPEAHRFGSRYIAVGDVEELRVGVAAEPTRRWRVPFIEVDRPDDDGIEVVGLTWQDVVDSYATWQDLIDAVPTWGGLV